MESESTQNVPDEVGNLDNHFAVCFSFQITFANEGIC